MTRLVLIAGLLIVPLPAAAQESLDTILTRGYVAHWLVCGPFTSDVEGGIAGAVARGDAALGNRDYMAEAGGIARLRPEHRQVINSEDDVGLWQRAGTTDTTLDLAPFFTDTTEGVSYAAFYADAAQRTDVYFDLQTPLGARVWLNGFPERDIRAAPLGATGVDRFVAALRPGMNLMVIEVPGAAFETLADAVGTTPRELGARAFSNRRLLTGKSGYEIALSLRRASNIGELFYVPQLESTGGFSGSTSIVRQEADLVFFNPDSAPSPAVTATLRPETSFDPIVVEVPPVPPGRQYRATIAIPVGNTAIGGTIPVPVVLAAGDLSTEFLASIQVREPSAAGNFYVVGGRWRQGESPGIHGEATSDLIEDFARQTAAAQADEHYGFDLGEAALWEALLIARPDLEIPVRRLVEQGRAGTHAGYARPDHRLVSGEVLWRDMAWAVAAVRTRLGNYAPVALHWDRPGVAPQYPQLLALAGIPGFTSNLNAPGIHPLSWQRSPQGVSAWHRRKAPSPGPATLDELERMVALQRREMLGLGIDSDLLINTSAFPPPEPFLAGALERLALRRPSVQFRGDGARQFFDDVSNTAEVERSEVPFATDFWNAVEPGSVIAQPRLKQAYTLVENATTTAETFATFAALLGADYPDAALDHAWRSLAYWAAPEILAVAEQREAYVDALVGLQEFFGRMTAIRDDAAAYIAREADTLSGAPTDTTGVQVLTVFNPAGIDRSDLCSATINVGPGGRFALQDDRGATVPVRIESQRPLGRQGAREIMIRFVAEDIPSMGYRTYFLVPATAPVPPPSVSEDTQIENDFYLIRVDPQRGAITALIDKTSGTDYAAQGPLNRLALTPEDTSQVDGGRELWTNGAPATLSGPARIRTEVTETIQSIELSASFGGGTATIRYTLARGVSQLRCSVNLEGVDLSGGLLSASFAPVAPGVVLTAGERYGAVSAARSRTRNDYQTGGLENASGSALLAAKDWSSAGPGDRLQVGVTGAIPLGRVAVVYGEDPMLRSAAREVVSALAQRGIPSVLMQDTTESPDFLWSDSTAYTTHDEVLDEGLSLRVVVGSPEQNRLARELAMDLPDDVAAEFSTRLRQGGVWLLDDADMPAAYPPTPTLLVAGLTAQRSAELGREVARGFRTLGYYSVPESMRVGDTPASAAGHGIAVLYPGAHLASMAPDGTLNLLLAHGGGPEQHDAPLRFEYAIHPYDASWRDAGLPDQARAFALPLFASRTDLHSGSQPASLSLLRTSAPGLTVTGVKAAGYATADMNAEAVNPRDGMIVRGFESRGQTWRGQLDLFVPWRHASTASFTEAPGVALPVSEVGITMEAGPFSIANVWAMPSTRHAMGVPAALGEVADESGSISTRYWNESRGPAPAGNLPVAITIQGALSGESPQVNVLVVNRSRDHTVDGLAELQASDGWSAGPTRFFYRLEPGAYHRETISLARGGTASGPGGIAAWTVQDDVTYRDVLLEDGAALELDVVRTGAQIKAVVRNRSGITAEGDVALAASPDYWTGSAQPGAVTATPDAAYISIPPYGEQEVLFALSDAEAAFQGAVRVAAHGQVLYQTVPVE